MDSHRTVMQRERAAGLRLRSDWALHGSIPAVGPFHDRKRLLAADTGRPVDGHARTLVYPNNLYSESGKMTNLALCYEKLSICL
jgi:hypothetical protein